MAGKVIDATLRFVDRFTQPMQTAVGKISDSSKAIARAGKDIKRVGSNIQKVGSDMTKSVTIPVVAMGAASIKAGLDYETAFAGVRKTVNATETEFQTLNKELLEMSKRKPMKATELAEIAEAAGQLGIAKENIAGFTETMADLKVSTNLGDEGASSLAKFANITKMSQADFDRLGSTVVELGNNYATTEADIVAMGGRLAAAGSQIGLSEGQILGFATALSSVGIEAEMGGTAFSKTMNEMKKASEIGFSQMEDLTKKTGLGLSELQFIAENDTKGFRELASGLGMSKKELNNIVNSGAKLEKFGEISKMTGKEFGKMFQSHPEQALETFIKGLGDTSKASKSTIVMLQELGFQDTRLQDSLTRMAGNSELVTNAVTHGDKAWQKNNALQNEAAEKYKTRASQLEMLKNNITSVGITVSDILLPPFMEIVGKVEKAVNAFSSLDRSTQTQIVKFAAMAAAGGPLLKFLGGFETKVGSTVGKIAKFGDFMPKLFNRFSDAKKIFNTSKGLTGATKPFSMLGGLAAKATGKFGKFGTAFRGIGKAMFTVLGPVGTVTVILGGLVVAGILVVKNWDKIKKGAKSLGKTIKSVFKACGIDIAGLKNKMLGLSAKGKETFEKLKIAGKKILPVFKKVLGFIGGTFVGGIKVALGAIIGCGTGILSGITDVLSGAMTALGGFADFITGIFTLDFEKSMGGIKDIFKGTFDSFKGIAKGAFNGVAGILNVGIGNLNKLGIKIPDWVPKIGGKNLKINIPKIPMLYKGTNNWIGGTAMIHDRGAEIVDLPSGSRVYPHDKSLQMARAEGRQDGNIKLTIAKIADTMIVRSDDDIEKIVNKVTKKIIKEICNISRNIGDVEVGDLA